MRAPTGPTQLGESIPPKPMMYIAYPLVSVKLTNVLSPSFFRLVLSVSPYFDRDAFAHHAQHVHVLGLDCPVYNNYYIMTTQV